MASKPDGKRGCLPCTRNFAIQVSSKTKEQFNKFGFDDFFEFKAYQVRMPCYFLPGKRLVITHGFIKKREGQAPRSEAERARNIRAEYQERLTSEAKNRR